MDVAEDSLPRLVGGEVLDYVRFLLKWTDAAPSTMTGEVRHCLITLTIEEEEEVMLPHTFRMERLPAVVQHMSEEIVKGAARPLCSETVRNAMRHVMSDGCAGSSRNHRTSSMRQVMAAEKLLSVARSTEYRGSFVLLLFHPNEAVRIWARETLLRLVNAVSASTVVSTQSVGLPSSSSGTERETAAKSMLLLGMQLLCTLKQVTSILLEVDEVGKRDLVAEGFCGVLAVLTSLDTKIAGIERSMLQDTSGVKGNPPVLFSGVSTATILLLGGSMLLYWLLSLGSTDEDTSMTRAAARRAITKELAVTINAQLGISTTLQPASLVSDTQRALVKILVHCLLDNAKRSATASREEEKCCQRRMRDLWSLASNIDPPLSVTSTSTKKSTAFGASCSAPAKSAGWLLRFLMRNASVQLNMRAMLPTPSTGVSSRRDKDDDDGLFHGMEVAVRAIQCMLTTLADTLPELASSLYYQEFLLSIQKECVPLSVQVALKSQEPQFALLLLRHFLHSDLVMFGCDQPLHPKECIRIAWEALPELLQSALTRQGNMLTDPSLSSSPPLLPLWIMELLDVLMAQPSASSWIFLKALKDGPQPLAWVFSKSLECITEILRGSMKEIRHQWERAILMRGITSRSTGSSSSSITAVSNSSNNNNNNSQGNRSSLAVTQLLSSGSSIPCLTHVLMISNDIVARRLGEVLSAVFLRSFSSLLHNTLRSDAANWLMQVIVCDPLLRENTFKLHDAKIDAIARENGAVWVAVMCSCNWNNLPTEIPFVSWWLCALLADVCVLEMSLRDRLLDLVLTQLPTLTGEIPKSIGVFSFTTNTNTSSNGGSGGGAAAAAILIASSEENEGNSSQANKALRQCAQHLLLTLVQKCSLYSPTIFARAIIHVAAMLPPLTRSSSDQSFKKSMLIGFMAALQKLPLDAKDMLLEYAPAWLVQILRSVQRNIDDNVADQNRRFQQYEFEEKRMKQLEEEDRKRMEAEEALCEENKERRRKELEEEREKAVAKRQREEDLSSLTIAQTPFSGERAESLQQMLHLQKEQPQPLQKQLRMEGSTGIAKLTSQRPMTPPPPRPQPQQPTALQRHLQQIGERRVTEHIRVENINKTIEAVRRIAGSTDILQRPPRIDDIIGHGKHCLSVNIPRIPLRFSTSTNTARDLYVASFLPHIALELRYELHQKFDDILDACRARGIAKKLHCNRAMAPSSNRNFAVNASEDNRFPPPSSWITENALPVVCAGNAVVNPIDPTCLRFSVMPKVTPDMTQVTSLTASLSDGDVAVVLLPIQHIAACLPQLFINSDASSGLPEAWRVMGCVPQVCIVGVLQPGQRTVALTVLSSATTTAAYPSSASSSSRTHNTYGITGGNGSGMMSLNFSHALRVFISSNTHFYIKRLCPLGPALAAVTAIHDIQRKIFASTLLEPHLAAKVSRTYHHAFERNLVMSERWSELSQSLVMHNCLNEWQKRAIAAFLFAVAPGWEVTTTKTAISPTLLPKSPNLFIIEGPPGTGKTQTIAALTLNLLRFLPLNARKVLVCAPSNCAVDEVLLRLRSLARHVPQLGQLQLLRVGVRESVGNEVLAATPPIFLEDCVGVLADGFNTSRSGMATGRAVRSGKGEMLSSSGGSRQQIRDQIMNGAHVIFSTLGSLGQLQRMEILFDIVIVDEASQGTEPDVLQALMLAKKHAVLVGDSKQLQPTVLCQAAAARGLKRALSQRLLHEGHCSYLLRVQYRMHPDICAFPNRYFYNKKLLTHASVMTRQRSESARALPLSALMERVPRFVFVNVQNGRMEWGRGHSLMNREEAEAVVKQMRRFRSMLQLTPEEFAPHAGIITFYQAQKDLILGLLSREERRSELQVSTVDSFQGKEKNVIFISCVRAPHATPRTDGGGGGSLGFLEDWHRINVALTRAKEFCLLFGHEQTFLNASAAATAAAAMKREQGHEEEEVPRASLAEVVRDDGDDDDDDDDDVILEASPPPPKPDNDPFVLSLLIEHVASLSTGESQKKTLDPNASAAMLTDHKELHVLRDLLSQS